jgi:hypothetical protein
MIDIKEQEELLITIARKIRKQMTIYAIGGTAMMFLALKNTTKDIDLVFLDDKDRQEFKRAAEELGYTFYDPILTYGSKENKPIMLTRGKQREERLDLFTKEIILFTFTEEMASRATATHEFYRNLIIKIADPHDLIILKCATDREKDREDIIEIITKTQVNWNTVIEEAKNQVKHGKTTALFELGCFLEELKEKRKADVPQETLDKLFSLVKKQAEEKQKNTQKNAKIPSHTFKPD